MRNNIFKKGQVFTIISFLVIIIFIPLSTGNMIVNNPAQREVTCEFYSYKIYSLEHSRFAIDDFEDKQAEYFKGLEDHNGTLSGYVTDPTDNPIEGALVRVHFHGTYEEDYSDENGYYHVTNIPICWCMKNATCSKEGYKTEWVLLVITENTTYDFVLYPLEPYPVFDGTMGWNGWWISTITVSFIFDPEEVAELWYNYNGWHPYTEPFVIDEEGEDIPLHWYWINYEGEQSPIASCYLDIDQTPPETNLTWEVYRENFKWYVRFILTAEDAISGMSPWLEFYINDVLLGEFEVFDWSTVEFEIQWSKAFKNVKFAFGCYDNAGNFAYEYVNGSDIKAHARSQSRIIQKSFNLWFIQILERFPKTFLFFKKFFYF